MDNISKKEEKATKLHLTMAAQYGRNVIKDSFYTAPLKIGTPRTEKNSKKVVLMMASAGVLKGDRFDYKICCEDNSQTELTEQSYSKIFDTQDGFAEKDVEIAVGENAVLDYHPCPVIPFQNSSFRGNTRIYLRQSSALVYSEVMAVGRIAMGEQFLFRLFMNKIVVYLEQEPVYVEHTQYRPKMQDLKSLCYFDGYTHQGSMYIYLPQKEEQKTPRQMTDIQDVILQCIERMKLADGELLFGISRAKQGIILKILGNQAQDIEEVFQKVKQQIFREYGSEKLA